MTTRKPKLKRRVKPVGALEKLRAQLARAYLQRDEARLHAADLAAALSQSPSWLLRQRKIDYLVDTFKISSEDAEALLARRTS